MDASINRLRNGFENDFALHLGSTWHPYGAHWGLGLHSGPLGPQGAACGPEPHLHPIGPIWEQPKRHLSPNHHVSSPLCSCHHLSSRVTCHHLSSTIITCHHQPAPVTNYSNIEYHHLSLTTTTRHQLSSSSAITPR